MDPQPIKVGQVWKRIRDGKLVKVTSYVRGWDDVSWRGTEGHRGHGAIYGTNFRRLYKMVSDVR